MSVTTILPSSPKSSNKLQYLSLSGEKSLFKVSSIDSSCEDKAHNAQSSKERFAKGCSFFLQEIEFINSILEKAHFKKASNELAKSLYFIELDVYVKSSLNEVSQEDGTLCDSVYGDIGAEASGKSERIDWLPEFSKPIAEKRIINMHKENGKDVKYCNYTPFSLDHKAVTLKEGEIQKISVVENINDPEEMHWSVKDASIMQLYAKTGR